MSHVKVSFEMSEYTAEADGVGASCALLNAIRSAGLEKATRLYQASTSELYGKVQEIPQKETTPFYPRSPYGVAKQYAYWMLINYREAYGMHLTNGILFNHESPRRGPTFVTRKITRAVARISQGKMKTLYLGNLDAKRDWGHARDYVEGMWLMVQRDEPDDYVLSTGECHSVKEFCEVAFARVGITVQWKGAAGSVDEIGVDAKDPSRVLVKVDPKYFRPDGGRPARRRLLEGQEAPGLGAQGHLQGARRGDGRRRPRRAPARTRAGGPVVPPPLPRPVGRPGKSWRTTTHSVFSLRRLGSRRRRDHAVSTAFAVDEALPT